MPDPALIDAISSGGLIAGCLFALWAFSTGRVVTGVQLAKVEASAADRMTKAELACSERIKRLETRLDEFAAIARKQAEVQQAQIVSLQTELGAMKIEDAVRKVKKPDWAAP